jgi:hypothetical protein
MAGRGGARAGAGRPKSRIPPWKGGPDYKALEAVAQQGSMEAMKTILWLAKHADTHTCRLAASIAVVNRAWGKPSQSHKHRHQVDPQDFFGV